MATIQVQAELARQIPKLYDAWAKSQQVGRVGGGFQYPMIGYDQIGVLPTSLFSQLDPAFLDHLRELKIPFEELSDRLSA